MIKLITFLHTFAATKLGFQFIPPSLSKGKDFSKGANFAVSGATALNLAFFQQNNITNQFIRNTSLNVQLGWFENMKPSVTPQTRNSELRRTDSSLCSKVSLLDKL